MSDLDALIARRAALWASLLERQSAESAMATHVRVAALDRQIAAARAGSTPSQPVADHKIGRAA